VCAICSRHPLFDASSLFAEVKSADFYEGSETSMTTKAASEANSESCFSTTACGSLEQWLSNDTTNRAGRSSVTTGIKTTIGAYCASLERVIEIVYLLATFGLLGGIPPLLNVAIRSALRAIASMRGSQVHSGRTIATPTSRVVGWSALRIRDLELCAMSLGGSPNPLACRN
jgi:hypothetical protein